MKMNNTKQNYATASTGALLLAFFALCVNGLSETPLEGDIITLMVYAFIGFGMYVWGFINGDEGAHEAER